MGKKQKKCSANKSKRILWYLFGAAGLGARGLAALSLLAIALMFCSIKKESKVFNQCVEEVRSSGKSISIAVSYCNGNNGSFDLRLHISGLQELVKNFKMEIRPVKRNEILR